MKFLHSGQQASCSFGLSGSGNGRTIVTIVSNYSKKFVSTQFVFFFVNLTHIKKFTEKKRKHAKSGKKRSNTFKRTKKQNFAKVEQTTNSKMYNQIILVWIFFSLSVKADSIWK